MLVVALVAAAGAAVAVLLATGAEERTVTATVTSTVSITETVTERTSVLPAAVERTRRAVQRAAAEHDVEALRELAPADLRYSFGENEPGGAVRYWLELESRGEDPIGTLARIMEMPYTLAGDSFFFPYAYDRTPDELGAYGRELLGDLVDSYVGDSYYGWRAAITADGDWQLYVAGD